MNSKSSPQFLPALTGLLIVSALEAWILSGTHKSLHVSKPDGLVATNTAPVITGIRIATNAPSAQELAQRKALYATFRLHPFTATQETDAFGWTSEDGKSPDVIKLLAHNELEFERMAGESARIYRRQLVYSKTTADTLVEQAKLSGEPVRQLTLPGLDGQEVQFAISKTELSPSGQSGTFSGEIAGRPGSMVTLAFKGGREAFTILSPADKLYLIGEPREPGELIVKSINPETYITGACGNE